ncbi:ArsR/SmtB family transcription factor [Desulfitobacterium sp. Sab5]|uniref:ArsR/SmtB family transcription factor n=1 Tax=Desulfitobacterium nosdiversum TaxID=3375356 RepID=UPI003CF61365
MDNTYENNAKVFKALSDPNRLLILEKLQRGEKCACVILEDLKIGQSTLSHHMKLLCESELVNSRRDGKWMHYSLNEKGCKRAINLLVEITTLKKVSKTTGSCSNQVTEECKTKC